MHPNRSQVLTADPAAIAAIMADPHDDPLHNKATRIAREVLKQASTIAEAGAGQGVLFTSLAHYAGEHLVVCRNEKATVLFIGKHAIVLSVDEGGEVPWVRNERMNVPDIGFFDCRVRIDDGLSEKLSLYVQAWMREEQLAVERALDHEEQYSAPAP